MRTARVAEQFDDFVQKTEACWLWTGVLNGAGYGVWAFGSQVFPAHRYSLEREVGPLGAGKLACHRRECPRKNCVRPDHLYAGDAKSNFADRIALASELDGREPRAIVASIFEGRAHIVKLVDATEGHQRFRAWFTWLNTSQGKLATRLRCNQCHVSHLLAGKRSPGLRLALAIERESVEWPSGPLRSSEWDSKHS